MFFTSTSMGLWDQREKISTAILLLSGVIILGSPSPCFSDPTQLKLTFGIRQEYNDNIFFDEENSESDFITTGIFGVDLGYEIERLQAHATARWEAFTYMDNSELDDVDQEYRISLDYQFTPRLKGGLSAAYIRDFRRDRETESTGVVFENEERERQEFETSWEYILSEITSFDLMATYWEDDYERAPTFQDRGRDLETYGGKIGLKHALRVFNRPTFGLTNIGYYRFRYETSDTDYFYLNLGFSAEINEKYILVLNAGPRYRRSDYTVARLRPGTSNLFLDNETTSDWGGSGLLSLTYVGEKEKTKWEAAISREVIASSGLSQPVDRTEARIDWNHWLDREWRLMVLARYFINESDRNRDNPTLRDIDEDIFVIHPRVLYRINKDWSFRGGYRYTHKHENDLDVTTERNQILLELVYNWMVLD